MLPAPFLPQPSWLLNSPVLSSSTSGSPVLSVLDGSPTSGSPVLSVLEDDPDSTVSAPLPPAAPPSALELMIM